MKEFEPELPMAPLGSLPVRIVEKDPKPFEMCDEHVDLTQEQWDNIKAWSNTAKYKSSFAVHIDVPPVPPHDGKAWLVETVPTGPSNREEPPCEDYDDSVPDVERCPDSDPIEGPDIRDAEGTAW